MTLSADDSDVEKDQNQLTMCKTLPHAVYCNCPGSCSGTETKILLQTTLNTKILAAACYYCPQLWQAQLRAAAVAAAAAAGVAVAAWQRAAARGRTDWPLASLPAPPSFART